MKIHAGVVLDEQKEKLQGLIFNCDFGGVQNSVTIKLRSALPQHVNCHETAKVLRDLGAALQMVGAKDIDGLDNLFS